MVFRKREAELANASRSCLLKSTMCTQCTRFQLLEPRTQDVESPFDPVRGGDGVSGMVWTGVGPSLAKSEWCPGTLQPGPRGYC